MRQQKDKSRTWNEHNHTTIHMIYKQQVIYCIAQRILLSIPREGEKNVKKMSEYM